MDELEKSWQARNADIQGLRREEQEAGSMVGGFRITVDSESGMKISGERDSGALDISDLPRFEPPQKTLTASGTPALGDAVLLMVYSIIAFAAAFVAFLRYDVR